MSDGFIPLNQSTPVQNKWQPRKHPNQTNYQNNRFQNGNGQRRSGYNRWGNNSRNSSYGSDSNNSTDNGPSIDAYLHPSMLEDPWTQLRQSQRHTLTNK